MDGPGVGPKSPIVHLSKAKILILELNTVTLLGYFLQFDVDEVNLVFHMLLLQKDFLADLEVVAESG